MTTATREHRLEVPASTGRAVRVAAGERIRLVDLQGGQVGDVWAFALPPEPTEPTEPAEPAELSEHHSAAHTRAFTSRLFPAVGEHFVTDARRPILTLAADSSPGHHDMLIAACDPARYAALDVPGHRSCAENLREALGDLGYRFAGPTPQPINIFMRIPVAADGRLSWLAATSRAGDAITVEAELDCVVVVSACPQDIVGINDAGLSPLAIDLLPPRNERTS